jgi:outer membrane protein assembly factor BamB
MKSASFRFVLSSMLSAIGMWCGSPLGASSALPEFHASASNEWRQVDANPSRSRYVSGRLTPHLKLSWQKTLPVADYPIPGECSMVGYGDHLYVTGTGAITALKTSNGHDLWKFKKPDWGAPEDGRQHPRPAMVTKYGVVFYDPASRVITLLRHSDGSAKAEVPAASGWFGPWRINDNTILLLQHERDDPGASKVTPFNPETMTLGPERGMALGGYLSDGSEVFLPGQAGTFGSRGQFLFLFDGRNTAVIEGGLHGKPRGLTYSTYNSSLQAGRDFIYRRFRNFGAKNGFVTLDAMDESGKIRWSRELPHVPLNGFMHHDLRLAIGPSSVTVYVQNALFCADTSTGKLRWWHPLPATTAGTTSASPLQAGNTVVVPSATHVNGLVYVLCGYSAASGRRLWRLDVREQIDDMIVHQGALYVLCSSEGADGKRTRVLKKFAQ